jgi:hypothetical protein
MEKGTLIRKNVQVTARIAKWFEEEAYKTGLSQSALMLMALSSYVDQQASMDMGENLKELLNQVKEKE